MKQVVKSVLRRVGYEIRPLQGHRRIPTMETALAWLAGTGLEVTTVLDVGASDGRWSRLCMNAFPDAAFVLYEPQPVHRPGLEVLLRDHPARVQHVDAAVGAVSGTAGFDAGDAFGGALVEVDIDESDTIDVEVVTLDDSVAELGLAGPFLVKLDTHGFERGILGGAHDVLGQSEALIIEAYAHRLSSEGLYFWELCAFLHERGFRPVDLVDVMHRERDGSLWQMDLVFLGEAWPGFASSGYR